MPRKIVRSWNRLQVADDWLCTRHNFLILCQPFANISNGKPATTPDWPVHSVLQKVLKYNVTKKCPGSCYMLKVFAAKYKGWKIYILTENRVANFPAAVNTSLNVEWSEANFAKQFSSCYFLLIAHIYVFCILQYIESGRNKQVFVIYARSVILRLVGYYLYYSDQDYNYVNPFFQWQCLPVYICSNIFL